MEIKIEALYKSTVTGCVVKVQSSDAEYVYYTEDGDDTHVMSITRESFLECCVPYNAHVDKPQHYQVFPDKEAIEIIASSMTTEQFYGYCLGNFLKYRLRIGAKDEVQQELGKSNKYKELYEKHKHLCK